ncbi:chromatin associated protein KTI12-domain-containing protein [Dunaliella salina]|uniref:Chromatin associated protein KTI12-domain-containing protein n=1 Tax=Dunaliella salina TaxID=3046 RepID=A0ABQ7H7N7_DUNSA|nr:chromatin associated protein KTI12-domain-containing protein [Dunaliella salina]|eukprot:KAF5842848.1 chromatin associated protein KTI12-domain-containing protein [Dunaliella salina]
MPLVVITGQPCSGKSTVAAQLMQVLQARGISTCNLVDEPSLHLPRNAAYKDVPSEKNTRALLKSTVERCIGRKGVTILDSINNIKGFRYELWCIAKAAGTRYCMVHVDTPVEQCKAWNAARNGDKYSDTIFDDLACRYERPDARNRWDAPLFTIKPCLDQPPASSPQHTPHQVLVPPPQPGPAQPSQASKVSGSPTPNTQAPTSEPTSAHGGPTTDTQAPTQPGPAPTSAHGGPTLGTQAPTQPVPAHAAAQANPAAPQAPTAPSCCAEPNHAEPGHVPNHAEPNQVQPDHAGLTLGEPNHAKPNHAGPYHAEPDQAVGAAQLPGKSTFKPAAGLRSAKQRAAQAAASGASLRSGTAASVVSGRTGFGTSASVYGGAEGGSRTRAAEAAAASTASWVSAGGQGPASQQPPQQEPAQHSSAAAAAPLAGHSLGLSGLRLQDFGCPGAGQQGEDGRSDSLENGFEEEDGACSARVLEAVVEAMVGVPEKVTMGGTCHLTPSHATSNQTMLGTNLLHDIDQAAQDVIEHIVDAQACAAGGAAGRVDCGNGSSSHRGGDYLIHLDQPLTHAELRRHKRAFLKLATKVTFARLQDGDAAKRTFVDYLISNVAGASRPPRQVV